MKWEMLKQQAVRLRPGEIRVLRLAAAGLKNSEIGAKVFLSTKTVDHMLGRGINRGIYWKLGLKNRPQATGWYKEVTTAYHYLKEMSDRSLSQAHQVRRGGLAGLAARQMEGVITELREEIDSRFNPLGQTDDLLRGLAALVFEQMIAFYEVALPEEIWPYVKPRLKELEDIAKACGGDREIFGLSQYAAGVAYYLTGDLPRSIEMFNQAWQNMSSDDDKLKILRTMSLDWAYLKERQPFQKTANKARDLLDNGNLSNFDLVCMFYEGYGRGQGILNVAEAFDTLEEGWRYYRKLARKKDKMPIRQVQLARSELEVLQHLSPTEFGRLEEVGQEGLRMADEYGYPRYARYMQQILEKSLN